MRITVRQPGEKPISIAEFNKLTWMKKLALKWFGGVENDKASNENNRQKTRRKANKHS